MEQTITIDKQIEKQIKLWSEDSFENHLATARNSKDVNYEHLIRTLENSRKNKDYNTFSKENVTGFSSNGWIDFKKKGAALFQLAYEDVCRKYPNTWTPLEFLISYYLQGINKGFNQAEDLELGRALRNLPSLLREDLIFNNLKKRGVNIVKPSSNDNVHKHADAYIFKNGTKITVWYYTNTNDSKVNLFDKLTNPKHRGEVSEGLNFLAPTENSDFYGWHIPSEEWIDSFLEALDKPYESFQEFKESLVWGYGIFSNFKFFEFIKQSEYRNQNK